MQNLIIYATSAVAGYLVTWLLLEAFPDRERKSRAVLKAAPAALGLAVMTVFAFSRAEWPANTKPLAGSVYLATSVLLWLYAGKQGRNLTSALLFILVSAFAIATHGFQPYWTGISYLAGVFLLGSKIFLKRTPVSLRNGLLSAIGLGILNLTFPSWGQGFNHSPDDHAAIVGCPPQIIMPAILLSAAFISGYLFRKRKTPSC